MKGVVAAGGALTAGAGAAMLAQGGNAVDAAVAAAFTSFIAEIAMVHWGGSGFAQLYDPATKQAVVYDFFSNMPGLGQHRQPTFLDFAKTTLDFGSTTQDFWVGRGSVAVPGNLFGLCQMSADFGRLPLTTLLEPALELAQDGLILPPYQAKMCDLLREIFAYTPSSRAIFLPHGQVIRAGERVIIPHLYETLRDFAQQGEEILRTGRLAQAIVADQEEMGGCLSADDLRHYQVYRRAPIRVPYRNYTVLLPSPSSLGGLLVAFTLRLKSYFNVPELGLHSAERYQLRYEVQAATQRARHWLEEQLLTTPLEQLITPFVSDDFVAGYAEQVAFALRQRHPYAPVTEPPSHPNTSHLSTLDAEGMAVSLTTTAGESAGYVVPNTGFILNNMLGEADLNPHGWHKWRVGERIPTMITPTILLQGDRVKLVIGSGGSARIRTAIVQTISNVVDHQMGLPEAVSAPRLHIEEGMLQCEYGFSEQSVAQLEKWGYGVNRWQTSSMYFGGTHCVGLSADNRLIGVGDRRRDGHTAIA